MRAIVEGPKSVNVDELQRLSHSNLPEFLDRWFWEIIRSMPQEDVEKWAHLGVSPAVDPQQARPICDRITVDPPGGRRVWTHDPVASAGRVRCPGATPPRFTPQLVRAHPWQGLPIAHTCARLLCLPLVTSKEELEKRLQFAIQNTDGFGLV